MTWLSFLGLPRDPYLLVCVSAYRWCMSKWSTTRIITMLGLTLVLPVPCLIQPSDAHCFIGTLKMSVRYCLNVCKRNTPMPGSSIKRGFFQPWNKCVKKDFAPAMVIGGLVFMGCPYRCATNLAPIILLSI